MNPVALYLVSGESLYVGCVMLLLAVSASPWCGAGWRLRVRNFAALMGAAMLMLASAPFAWAMYGVFLGVFVTFFILWNRKPSGKAGRWIRIGAAAAVAGLCMVMAAMELPYRRSPTLGEERHGHLTVLGDSISAGIKREHPPWPAVFNRKTGISVTNLSRPGIGVADAVPLARAIGPTDTLVLLEIGGNDLLGGVSAEDFATDLEKLLRGIASPGRTVVMFELPLLPHKIPFGQVQRRLAKKYHVYLIPRRLFVEILTGADATSDGLHLSAAGAERMSDLVERILGANLVNVEKAGTGPATRGR